VRRGRVNKWDLVDASAASPELWERRVAVPATYAFIRRGDPTTTLVIAIEHFGPEERARYRSLR
jgi:hypothetical protein